jgi:hypothetical protein
MLIKHARWVRSEKLLQNLLHTKNYVLQDKAINRDMGLELYPVPHRGWIYVHMYTIREKDR